MEMWERFDTFGHQNICFTMKMKDFTLKESQPCSKCWMWQDLHGWEDLEYLSLHGWWITFVSIGFVAKVETGNHGFHHQIGWWKNLRRNPVGWFFPSSTSIECGWMNQPWCVYLPKSCRYESIFSNPPFHPILILGWFSVLGTNIPSGDLT